MSTSTAQTPTGQEEHRSLSCMEIWGGSQAFDNAIAVPGIASWVYSRPHGGGTPGGDVHYVSMCACGEIARFFLADISGHGADASEPAADVRRLMRRYINTLDQTRFVRALNDRMNEWSREGRFATAILTTYFAPTRQLLVCNAGHPPPMIYRAAEGAWEWLQPPSAADPASAGNPPIGVVEGIQFVQFATTLDRDDRVLIFSDSLFESRDPSGDQLGREGLLRNMNNLPAQMPDMQARSVVRFLIEHHGSGQLEDDLTILLLHHHGQGQIQRSIGERIKTMGRMLGLLPV